jgi:hypothetical protein
MFAWVYRAVDTAIDDALSKRVIRDANLTVDEYFKRRGIKKDDRLNQILANLREVYDNTASLLTHISAMIAVLGIMLVVVDKDSLFSRVIEIEVVLYTIMAALCVYNLRRYELARKLPRDYLDDLYLSYIKRRYLYVIYTDVVLVITLLFLGSMIAHFVFGR